MRQARCQIVRNEPLRDSGHSSTGTEPPSTLEKNSQTHMLQFLFTKSGALWKNRPRCDQNFLQDRSDTGETCLGAREAPNFWNF